MKQSITQIIAEHFAKLGKKGGKVKSEKKAEAARANAKKPRPRRRTKTTES